MDFSLVSISAADYRKKYEKNQVVEKNIDAIMKRYGPEPARATKKKDGSGTAHDKRIELAGRKAPSGPRKLHAGNLVAGALADLFHADDAAS